MKKRLISLLLAFSMVISLLPVGAFAETPTAALAVKECQGLTISGGRPTSQNSDKTKGWTYDGTTLTILDGYQLSGDSNLRVTCDVVNQGIIAGGIFTGKVTLPAGYDAVISGGVFGNLDYMEYNTKPGTFRAKITGGVFTNTTAWQIIDSGSKTYTISTTTSFVINTTNQNSYFKITVVTDDSNQCGYAISLGTMEIKNINGQDTKTYCAEHGLTYQVEDATYGEYSLTIPADHVYSEDITLNEDIVLSIVDGYPKQSNHGANDVTGDGWDFVASTDTAHPENGVLTLYQTEVELDPAAPVKCKTLIRNSTTSRYMTNIKSGTFDGPVELKTGLITDGTFNSTVTLTSRNNCYINGGTYNGAVTVNAGYLNGGLYKNTVELTGANSEIYNGAFAQTVTNNGGKIIGGAFAGSVVGKYYAGIFAQEPDHSQFASADYHVWTLTTGSETYVFNSLLTLSFGTPLYVVGGRKPGVSYESYYPSGYYSLTSGTLKYVNQKECYQIGNYEARYFDVDDAGQIVRFNNYDPSSYHIAYKYEFRITDDATVSLDSRIIPLEIESNGYPKSTEGGTIARSGLGWAFTPSTTGDPADGVLTLTGSDLALGSNPVECKVVLKGAGDNSYASIASGTFNNTVTLEPYAALKDGIYNGAVSSNGTSYIYGGTFNNTVDFNYGFICGGTFNKPVSSNLNISNGIFMDTVTLKYPGILVGGIYAGDVKLDTSNKFRHGGLFAKLPDGLREDNLVWTLTTTGDDSYTFGGVLTLNKDHPLYLAAPSNSYDYKLNITGSDFNYANQIKITGTATTIKANGVECGTITAGTDNYKFALTQSATVLLQSALDPLWIDETGYPVGTNGGENSYTGEGWSYSQYGMHGTIKGKLTLSSGTFTINSDVLTQCDVEVETDVTLNGGDFAGRVSSRGVIANGTFRNSVELLNATGSRVNESTIRGGIFTETSEVTIRNNSFISGGDFSGKVELNWGAISGGTFTETSEVTVTGGNSSTITNGTFNGTVDSKGQINGGTFNGTVTNHGPISAGTFTGEVNNSGRINDGAFSGTVNNNGAIYDGTLTGKVNNNHLILGGTFEGPVTNRLTIEFGTFTDSVTNYGTIMGAEFRGEVLNDTDPEDAQSSGIIKFSTEPGVYAPPLFTETSRVTNTGNAKILDGTFLGTVTGTVEGGVYINKPESTNPISRMTYRYQDSEGNGKTDVLTINYKIEDAAYVVRSDTTHAYVTLTSKASPLKNINGDPFSEYACAPLTWALYGKLPDAEQIILNKATEFEASDLTFVVPDDTDNDGKIIYDGQPHEARFETPEVLDYLLGSGIYELNDEGGLKVYYCRSGSSADDSTDTAPTEIGTYTVLFKKNGDWQTGGWTFEITENVHTVTVTDGFIVKVEHPGAVDADDTTGEDTTEEPVSTAEVQYGDTVTVTIDAGKFPSGMVFDRWETSPVDLQLTSADGESYKTVTFTMPAENVTLRAVPCTVEEKAASGGSSPLSTAALVVVGGAAAGVLVWQGYELGTELYLHSVLPSGAAIPETRGQLAVVLWQAAGSPAPAAPLAPDAADTQKAMAWVVEHALIEDKTGNFDPREPVNKTEVIRAWNKLHEQGLAKQAK